MPRTIRQALTALLFLARIAAAQLTPGNPATTPVPRPDAWWIARHEEKVAEAQHATVDLLLVGDSITQNYEKTGPAPNEVFFPTWQHFFAPHKAMNLGFSGDQTQHVLWRLQHGETQGLHPANIVLLIGTNNTWETQTPPQAAEGVIACVDELHRLMPKAKILVVNILPSAISATKSDKDMAINQIVNAHFAAGSPYARTLDLSYLYLKNGHTDASLFYDPGLNPPMAPLHPNSEGQRRMAEAITQALYGK